MPTTFAAIDVGSNAIRLQIASVDQPGTYRVIEVDRRPVRLGHGVFETGALDPDNRTEALEALKRFRNIADKHSAKTIRAVATSAMREAKDGPAFIKEAAALGAFVDALSEAIGLPKKPISALTGYDWPKISEAAAKALAVLTQIGTPTYE